MHTYIATILYLSVHLIPCYLELGSIWSHSLNVTAFLPLGGKSEQKQVRTVTARVSRRQESHLSQHLTQYQSLVCYLSGNRCALNE